MYRVSQLTLAKLLPKMIKKRTVPDMTKTYGVRNVSCTVLIKPFFLLSTAWLTLAGTPVKEHGRNRGGLPSSQLVSELSVYRVPTEEHLCACQLASDGQDGR